MTDIDSAPFWQALRRHRVTLLRCRGCERRRHPPTPRCPYCADHRSDRDAVPGTGTVYAAITVHRTLDVVFEHETPYTIVTVDLDGGGRLVGRSSDRLHIGDRVRPRFADHDSWTELRFEPAS